MQRAKYGRHRVLKLMLSIMFESTSFSDEIVEQEKKNAKDRIMAMMNDKRQYAVERCIETMFEGENYAISKLGTQEGIDKITADNLKKHYENIITSSVIDIYINTFHSVSPLLFLIYFTPKQTICQSSKIL